MLQQGGNQQAANSAIADKVRINSFKLYINQRDFDQRRQICSGMDELFHVAK